MKFEILSIVLAYARVRGLAVAHPTYEANQLECNTINIYAELEDIRRNATFVSHKET